MTRPIILLDVDGVLANFIEANLVTLRALGVERQHDDVVTWDLEDCLGLSRVAKECGIPVFVGNPPPAAR